jgi:hypothetical protein
MEHDAVGRREGDGLAGRGRTDREEVRDGAGHGAGIR